MRFVCLGYADMSLFAAMSESEMAEAMEECFAYDDRLRKGGHFIGGEALQAANEAVTVRSRNGQADPTDGPFAETKEQIGGILFLEARDIHHAVELISQHPGIKYGPFEIRPANESMNVLIKARSSQTKTTSHSVDLILQIFEDHLGYLKQAISDIPDDRFVDQPNGVVNHPAWTLSHLNVSIRFLLDLLDVPQPELTEEAQRQFGPGSIPSTNPDDYKSKPDLVEDLSQLHQQTAQAVRAKHEAYFPKPAPEALLNFAPTIGHIAVYLLASHEAYHLAQINQWRRAADMMNHKT